MFEYTKQTKLWRCVFVDYLISFSKNSFFFFVIIVSKTCYWKKLIWFVIHKFKKNAIFCYAFRSFFSLNHTTYCLIFYLTIWYYWKNKINNKIKLNYRIYLIWFLRFDYEHCIIFETLNFIIISNLLMNAYFFKMHNMIIFFHCLIIDNCDTKFDIIIVFRKLYYFHCFIVFIQLINSIEMIKNYCDNVETFVKFFFQRFNLNLKLLLNCMSTIWHHF